MTEPSRVIGDIEFPGAIRMTGSASYPANSIGQASMDPAAVLPHTILVHRMGVRTSMPSTDAVVSQTDIIHAAYRDGTILGVDAAVYAIADSTGLTVTIDILKSTGGTTGTSILSTPLVFNSTNATDRTVKAAVLSGTPTLSNGNLLIRTITVAGSTGVQAKGLHTEVTLAQDPVD